MGGATAIDDTFALLLLIGPILLEGSRLTPSPSSHLEQSQCDTGIERPAVAGKEERLACIRRAVGHDIPGRRIGRVDKVIQLDKELGEPDVLVVLDFERLVKVGS